jgi:ATP-dependent DNA helicase RecQ
MLKVLEVEGAIERDGAKYRRTLEPWTYPTDRLAHITEQRRAEQRIMDEYLESDACLMELLGRVLDDPSATRCGRCSRCTGERIDVELDHALVVAAQEHLRRQPLEIDPRKLWAAGGRIPAEHRIEPGRALSFWGDGGWGRMVKEQRADGHFTDELVGALVRLVREWAPEPAPTWAAFVPSRRAPDPVRDLAARVARGLGLALHDAVRRVRDAPPQVEMENRAQQHANVAGAFAVDGPLPPGPVLLVDDVVDSRWTLTEVGSCLRQAGSGAVLPVALAQANGG